MSKDNSIDALKKRVGADPSDLDAVLDLVRRYNCLGEHDNAFSLCRSMMKRHSRAYSFLLEFANVLYKRGDLREALVIFRKLTEFRPERIEAWNNLAILELSAGNLDAARKALGKVREIEPSNVGALCNTGNYFAEKGDAAVAATYFERALEAKPNFADAWYNLGNSYMALGHFREAKGAFEKAIKYDKKLGSAYKNLGFVCEQLEDYDNALRCYVKAASLNKMDGGVQINMAGLHLRFGDYEKALACGRRAVSLAPADHKSWNALSRAATHLGDGETYYRAVTAMINQISDDDLAHSISDLREMGFEFEAEELLEYLVKINRSGTEVDALPFTESHAPKIPVGLASHKAYKIIDKREHHPEEHKKKAPVKHLKKA
jgi:tetratricopeptide (TPR) repeat protein